ncbi:hypothetical protein FACS1894125_2870 [Actinomycetota bacterium]|nr:hypothetical protein FACS1894125_2870 [Actinomycetota bacterium]
MSSTTARILGIASVLAVWFLLADVVFLGTGVIIDPIKTVIRIVELGQTDSFWLALTHTIASTAVSFVFAYVLAFFLALLGHWWKPLKHLVKPYITIMRSMPTVAVILVLFMVIDWSFITFVVAFLVTFPLLFTQLSAAFAEVDLSEIDAAKSIGLNGPQRVFFVYLGVMQKLMISAVRSGFGLNLKVVIASEVLGIPTVSLGLSIVRAKQVFEYSDAFVYLVVTVLLAFLVDKILEKMECVLY